MFYLKKNKQIEKRKEKIFWEKSRINIMYEKEKKKRKNIKEIQPKKYYYRKY